MRALAVAVSLVVLGSSSVLAQPADPGPGPDYAVETLAVDGATMALSAVVALTDARLDFSGPPKRFGTFAATWYLASTAITPAVHFARRRRVGWASLGIRMGLPLLSSGIGALSYCMSTIEQGRGFADDCGDIGAPAGMIAGTAAAAAIDAYLLARPHPGNPRPPSGTWYGWQTLTLDALGLALGVYFASNPESLDNPEEMTTGPETATLNLGLGLYTIGVLGAPWIHVARGHHLRALGSFGMRAVMPALTLLPGIIGWCAGTAGSGSGSCSETGLGVGFLSGAVLAAVIDGFVLSWDDPPAAAPAPAPRSDGPPGLSLVPGLQLEPGGARLTLSSRF